MRPKDFSLALKKEVPNLTDKLTNAKLTLIVHYLAQEELGMVSFDKLNRALNLSDKDQPLRQDLVQEIRAKKAVIKQDL